MASHPLAKAAREVNDYSGKHGLHDTCEHYGFKTDDVHYMAEQRALRAIFAFKGINLNLSEPAAFMFDRPDHEMMVKLAAAYMDGFLIGWRARVIADQEP